MQPDKPSRWQIAIPLILVIYLFVIANTLFSGMFDELNDRRAHSYAPTETPAQIEQIAAFATTLALLVAALVYWARWRAFVQSLAAEERLIVLLLSALVTGTALRSGFALLLWGEIGPASALEAAILGAQAAASSILVIGGLRLLLRGMAFDDDSA